MRFDAQAYEKAFPRETSAPKRPEPIKPGNVLEEADKVGAPEPDKTPEPGLDDTGGGAADGN